MAEAAAPARRTADWRFWTFIAFMLALMLLFLGLGWWQVQRLGEKERLIANVASRLDLAPTNLPPAAEWVGLDPEVFDFRPVTVRGTYQPADTVLVFTSLGEARGRFSGPGYWVMTPLAVVGGGSIFVNRGFVPQESGAAFAAAGTIETGDVHLTGIARKSEEPGSFTPGPDAARRIEWLRDVDRLGAMSPTIARPLAPIYLDLPAGPDGALPQGGELTMEFPNNHLGYAITWFGFAALVPFLLWFWVRRQRVPAPKP